MVKISVVANMHVKVDGLVIWGLVRKAKVIDPLLVSDKLELLASFVT